MWHSEHDEMRLTRRSFFLGNGDMRSLEKELSLAVFSESARRMMSCTFQMPFEPVFSFMRSCEPSFSSLQIVIQ